MYRIIKNLLLCWNKNKLLIVMPITIKIKFGVSINKNMIDKRLKKHIQVQTKLLLCQYIELLHIYMTMADAYWWEWGHLEKNNMEKNSIVINVDRSVG